MIRRFHRICAVLLLVAYTATGTAAIPSVVMALAQLDASHSVSVTESETGTQVLLHHDGAEYTPRVCDHKSPLTRAVVSMCSASSAGDHCLTTRHLPGNSLLERDEVDRHAKVGAILNELATADLAATPFEHDVPPLPSRSPLGTQACNRDVHRAIATVRLLI